MGKLHLQTVQQYYDKKVAVIFIINILQFFLRFVLFCLNRLKFANGFFQRLHEIFTIHKLNALNNFITFLFMFVIFFVIVVVMKRTGWNFFYFEMYTNETNLDWFFTNSCLINQHSRPVIEIKETNDMRTCAATSRKCIQN